MFFKIYLRSGWVGFIDDADGKVGNGESQDADDEADEGVKDSFAGFFDFASIARGGHIIDATDDNEDDGDNTGDGDNTVKDSLDSAGKLVTGAAAAAGGVFNVLGDVRIVADTRVSKDGSDAKSKKAGNDD